MVMRRDPEDVREYPQEVGSEPGETNFAASSISNGLVRVGLDP